MEITCLEEQLLKLNAEIEVKRKQLEYICREHHILFKPWPKINKRENVETTPKESTSPVESAESELTAEVKKELEMVHKLLSKAEKTRTIKKISQVKSQDITTEELVSEMRNINLSENTADNNSNVKDERNQIIIGDTTLNKLQTDPKTKSGRSNKQCLGQSKEISDKTSSLDGAAHSKQLTTDVFRTFRPHSGSLKTHYQAHHNAPFKTDPNIRVPSRSKSSKHSAGTVAKHSKSVSAAVSFSSHSTASDSVKMMSDSTKTTSAQLRVCETLKMEVNDRGIQSETESVDVSTALQCQISKLDKTSEISEMRHTETFSLLKDGSKLSIPGCLRKLVSTNHQLRQKYEKQKITKKVGNNNPCAEFLDKVQKEFQASNLLKGRKLILCHQSLKKLIQLLNDLNLSSITELSSPEEVLHAKMMTDFILTTFDELEENCSELIEMDMGKHKQKEIPVICRSPPTSTLFWLPAQSSTQGFEPPALPTTLTYQSQRDLCQFYHTVFKTQYVELQRYLVTCFKKHLLPQLQALDPTSKGFVKVFRGVHALLTSDGQHQPCFVDDSLDEELKTAGYNRHLLE